MIKITDKHNCCGCSACANACPKACIVLQSDEQGFLYPAVDGSVCIDCGLCEKVCPFLVSVEAKHPLQAYAAINPSDSERLHSSSGGIFTMLMHETLNNRGVVFGAAFDKDWNVCHISIEKKEDIPLLQGSKYVQSDMGCIYKSVKEYLKTGRKVLFSGTACQIAGLKGYLQKDYENLLLVDVVCHGVPSPKIWRDYLKKFGDSIKKVSFRDKKNGWLNYDFAIGFSNKTEYRESHNSNLFMQGFIHDLYNRPSCHNCKLKAGRCRSDITLGDFWGIELFLPALDDDKGVSIVTANTAKGETAIASLSLTPIKVDYDRVVSRNITLVVPTPESKWEHVFWSRYNNNGDLLGCIAYVLRKKRPSFIYRLCRKLKSFVK